MSSFLSGKVMYVVMRKTRGVSNIIATVLLIVISIALAVSVYYFAVHMTHGSTNPLSVTASLVSSQYVGGKEVITTQVSITNNGHSPITLNTFNAIPPGGSPISMSIPAGASVSTSAASYQIYGPSNTIPPGQTESFTVVVVSSNALPSLVFQVQGTDTATGTAVSATSGSVAISS